MKKKKIDCSKKILIVSYAVALSLILFMLVGIVLKLDVSPIENVTLASLGEVATATGFYYNKSKAENKLKIISSLPQEFKENVDINQILNQ